MGGSVAEFERRRLGKGIKTVQGKSRSGMRWIHPKSPLDLTKETRGEIVEFPEKVEQSGKWPQ